MVEKLKVGIATNTIGEAETIIRNLVTYNVFSITGIYVKGGDFANKSMYSVYKKAFSEVSEFYKESYNIIFSSIKGFYQKKENPHRAETSYIYSNDIEAFFKT
jgi:hypothetical protein